LLTAEEREIIDGLKRDFTQSPLLRKHAAFLFSNGGIYKIYNNNLLFHGCIPMDENYDFISLDICGKKVSGKALMDRADYIVHRAYFHSQPDAVDFTWYLWCGSKSPLFGREKMTTFERRFIEDKTTHVENKSPYYNCVKTEAGCKKILSEFSLNSEQSHIINGHIPVAVKKGEKPVKANGKFIDIDGGFCKAYQSTTGIAGYTLILNSREMRLAAHTPFNSIESAVMDNSDIHSTSSVIETMPKRILIGDTDIGKKLLDQINDMSLLLQMYVTEGAPEDGAVWAKLRVHKQEENKMKKK
jgi:fructose-1,6-bisphosphatase-3